jgi:hypothetical protein
MVAGVTTTAVSRFNFAFNYLGDDTHDHSKWAINGARYYKPTITALPAASTDPIFCVSDLNRQDKQRFKGANDAKRTYLIEST